LTASIDGQHQRFARFSRIFVCNFRSSSKGEGTGGLDGQIVGPVDYRRNSFGAIHRRLDNSRRQCDLHLSSVHSLPG
jgi:hypothetical protein